MMTRKPFDIFRWYPHEWRQLCFHLNVRVENVTVFRLAELASLGGNKVWARKSTIHHAEAAEPRQI